MNSVYSQTDHRQWHTAGACDDPMCLVFISFQNARSHPVMIGANREESRRRPTTSPVCCVQQHLHCLLAGADHGPDGSFPEMGTWLGVNQAGVAVAVTNRHDGELTAAEQIRSRGLLTVELLGYREPEQAAHWAQLQLARGGFGGCNFLIASAAAAFVVEAPGARRIALSRLQPGIHAMTNLDLDDDTDSRIALVRATVRPADFISSAGRLGRDERILVSGAERGTISSSMILAGDDIVLYHIDGNPRGRDYQQFRLIS
jgi:uncharacterized protein with NRDE domain